MNETDRETILDYLRNGLKYREASADQLRGQGLAPDKRYVIFQSDGTGELLWVGKKKVLAAPLNGKLETATNVTKRWLLLAEEWQGQ